MCLLKLTKNVKPRKVYKMTIEIQHKTQVKSHIRQIINLIFELERTGQLDMQDWFSMIDDLDNFVEVLKGKDNHGR